MSITIESPNGTSLTRPLAWQRHRRTCLPAHAFKKSSVNERVSVSLSRELIDTDFLEDSVKGRPRWTESMASDPHPINELNRGSVYTVVSFVFYNRSSILSSFLGWDRGTISFPLLSRLSRLLHQIVIESDSP